MIDLLHRGNIAICRVAHGKANAFDIELCGGIMAAFEACRDSSDAAVVITGQGRMFSAGVDLVRLVDDGPDYVRAFLPALTAAFEAVFAFPKPVVAALNGERPGVTGSMHVTKDQIRLDVALGFLLTPLKSTIEKEIHAQLDRMLGESGKATKSTKA